MKPELKQAFNRLEYAVQRNVWHEDMIRVAVADVKMLLGALKPQNPGISVPAPEAPHPHIGIKTFTPPEDFLEQIHEAAVAELLGEHGRVMP